LSNSYRKYLFGGAGLNSKELNYVKLNKHLATAKLKNSKLLPNTE